MSEFLDLWDENREDVRVSAIPGPSLPHDWAYEQAAIDHANREDRQREFFPNGPDDRTAGELELAHNDRVRRYVR